MISLDITAQVATVVLDRAPVNAINEQWIAGLNSALDRIEADGGVSVVHIKSALRAFCAGADLKLMENLLDTPDGCDAMIGVVRDIQLVLARLEAIGAVSVAEIGGAALGGGLEMALACDLRVAGENARLGLPEAGLGLLPGAGGTQRLGRITGEAVARRLILGAEVIDGREAARLGLVQWVRPDGQLAAWTAGLVARLGALPAQALAASKRCIAAARDQTIDGYALELEETRRLHDHVDTQARIRAFLAEGRAKRAQAGG